MTDFNLTPAQIADARASYASYGLDVAQFDAAVADTPQPQQEALQEAPQPQETFSGIEVQGSSKTPLVTAEQALEMAQALRDAGVSEEAIAKALAEDGYAPLPADTRDDDQKDFDRSFGKPDPSEYNVDHRGRWPDGTDLATIAAAHTDL